jgi:hypothetical protein
MGIFDLALNSLDDDPFEERPADLKEFLYEDEYMGFRKDGIVLSDKQELLVDLMSQVYRKDDLVRLYGRDRGEEIWSHTKKEIIMMLGKGSGKDFTSTIGCAYLVHKLLCLKEPAKYFGKPPGDAIDILNIAINAQQANNVFFKGFSRAIERSPWFAGKYDKKAGEFKFDKHVTVHSGHSEREAWEGYNVILVILDEIAGFAIDNNTGNENAKTADAVYKMYSQSVLSRFPDVGKVVELSFPRFQGDFITRRYDKVIKEKETIHRSYTLKINPELPDGLEENEIVIEWDEDHILQYDFPNVFAMRRPSWEVNPTKKIEDYTSGFLDDPVDTLSRFACMPPKAVDAFFKSAENVEYCFRNIDLALDEDERLRPEFEPIPGVDYFIHVDLAQKHDNCAVAMAHVSGWGTVEGKKRGIEPKITVDVVKHWKPRSDQPIDLEVVTNFILDVWRAGFNVKLVTFDRWNSTQTIEDLRSYGLKAELLSVALPHYMDFLIAVNERRVDGPDDELLKKEMLELRIMKNSKVDHPRKGSKDLSDAVAGAIYNAAKYSKRSSSGEIEVYTRSSAPREEPRTLPENVVVPPKREMPQDISEFLARARII